MRHQDQRYTDLGILCLAQLGLVHRCKKEERRKEIKFGRLGSGFKCNSAVWVALRNVKASTNNPWEHLHDKYPDKIDSDSAKPKIRVQNSRS